MKQNTAQINAYKCAGRHFETHSIRAGIAPDMQEQNTAEKKRQIKRGINTGEQTYFTPVTLWEQRLWRRLIVKVVRSPIAVFAVIMDEPARCFASGWNHQSRFDEGCEHVCQVCCDGDQPVIWDKQNWNKCIPGELNIWDLKRRG